MGSTCRYVRQTPMNNRMCNSCSLFMNTCLPTADKDGYALGGECDSYLCNGCSDYRCSSKILINL